MILKVLPRLGFGNIFYMIYYRLTLKIGLRKLRFKGGKLPQGDFLVPMANEKKKNPIFDEFSPQILNKADNIIAGFFTYYHYHKFNLGKIPNWFYDPFSKRELYKTIRTKHWTEINEFDLNTGDIKNLWEISRFDWVTDLVRAYAVSEDEKYLDRLRELLNNWSEQNPVNFGVNWRCGQETSIRVMKLFYAQMIIGGLRKITPELFEWIYAHLERIDGNIRYAIAQDNNHGTSEAAGLYIGALWLLNQSVNIPVIKNNQLVYYKRKGRRILEDRIRRLILQDGTFSQKSTNYHRVVMDTMSFVLFGMRKFEEPRFSQPVQDKLGKLGEWLLQMVCSDRGEVPNLGANDGAMFETLHSMDYRDYRPSLQLYYALLGKVRIWRDVFLDEPLLWRGIKLKKLSPMEPIGSGNTIKDNEFIQMTHKDILINIKATQANFRPENDVLNIDIWYKGQNVLMDSGTYSYNSVDSFYFKSIKAHNTLQFGEGEPMPKISRFLNGSWITVNVAKIVDHGGEIRWEGEYTDYKKNKHRRIIAINKEDNAVELTDIFESTLQGVKYLRFHTPILAQGLIKFSCINAKNEQVEAETLEAEHSLYYMEKAAHHVYCFKSTANKDTLRTRIQFLK